LWCGIMKPIIIRINRPILRMLPALYRWRMKLRIYRWYRVLLVLEQDLAANLALENREELVGRLRHIEREVNKMKVPASFGDQFYGLAGTSVLCAIGS